MEHIVNVEFAIESLSESPYNGVVFTPNMIPDEFAVEMMKAKQALVDIHGHVYANNWYKRQLLLSVKKLGMTLISTSVSK